MVESHYFGTGEELFHRKVLILQISYPSSFLQTIIFPNSISTWGHNMCNLCAVWLQTWNKGAAESLACSLFTFKPLHYLWWGVGELQHVCRPQPIRSTLKGQRSEVRAAVDSNVHSDLLRPGLISTLLWGQICDFSAGLLPGWSADLWSDRIVIYQGWLAGVKGEVIGCNLEIWGYKSNELWSQLCPAGFRWCS